MSVHAGGPCDEGTGSANDHPGLFSAGAGTLGTQLFHLAETAAGGVSRFQTDWNRVSGKPHRNLPERVMRLKAFRMRCVVSGKLMIRARCQSFFVPVELVCLIDTRKLVSWRSVAV
jgi:hypothetical protein